MQRVVIGLALALALVAPSHAQTINGILPRTGFATLTAAGSTTCTSTGTGCAVLQPNGYSSISISVTGTWSGTIAFESCTNNCSIAASWASLLLVPPGSTTGVTSTSANGQWLGGAPTFLIRARMTVHTSGSAAVSLYATLGNIQPVAIGGGGGGGGTSPGSPDTSVQFNASGSFAGNAGLTYNNGLNALSLSGADNNPRLNIVNSAPTGTPAHYFVSAPESGRMVIGGINNSGNLNQIMQWSPSQSPADVLLETCNAGLTSCPFWQIDPTNGFRVQKAGAPAPFFQVDTTNNDTLIGSGLDPDTYLFVATNAGGSPATNAVYAQGCDGTTAANCASLLLHDSTGSAPGFSVTVPPTNQHPTILLTDGRATQMAFVGLDTDTGQFAVNDSSTGTNPGSLALQQVSHVFQVCNNACAHKFTYDWTGDGASVTGTIEAQTNFIAGGTPGKLSATTCTAFKFGLCTAGTDEPIVTRAEYDALAARLAALEHSSSVTPTSASLWTTPRDLPLSARLGLSALALGFACARLRPGRA